MSAGGWAKKGGGSYSCENGHLLLWTRWDNPEDRPLNLVRDELVGKFGEAKANWMIGNSRNLCLYPNVYLMDQFSSQIRVFRPIAVDRTEVTLYCIAPKGEAPEPRAPRGEAAPPAPRCARWFATLPTATPIAPRWQWPTPASNSR